MNWLDAVAAFALLVGAFRGLRRGLLREVFDLLGIFLAFYLALRLEGPVAERISSAWGLQQSLARAASFAVIWIGTLLGVGVLARLVSMFSKFSPISSFDGMAGAGLGVLKAALVLSFAVWLMALIPWIGTPKIDEMFRQSRLAKPVVSSASGLYNFLGRRFAGYLPAFPQELPFLQIPSPADEHAPKVNG